VSCQGRRGAAGPRGRSSAQDGPAAGAPHLVAGNKDDGGGKVRRAPRRRGMRASNDAATPAIFAILI
jgi:hypothetical protein